MNAKAFILQLCRHTSIENPDAAATLYLTTDADVHTDIIVRSNMSNYTAQAEVRHQLLRGSDSQGVKAAACARQTPMSCAAVK